MEMINRAVYQDLKEAGMADASAQAVAAHIPDWSQFATKQDLEQLRQDMSQLENRLGQDMSQLENRLGQDMSQLENRLDQKMSQLGQDMSQLESRLIRWMVGIFLTFLALLGGLVTLSLNIVGLLG